MSKRFLNWKVITVAVILLLLLAVHLGVRKVFVLNVDLGMDKAAVVAALGQPTIEWNSSLLGATDTLLYEYVLFDNRVYRRSTVIVIDKAHGVVRIDVVNSLFGWGYQTTRQ